MTFTFLRCGSQIDEASASFTWKDEEKKSKQQFHQSHNEGAVKV